MTGGTIRPSVSSSSVTDPITVTPTTSPSLLLLGGILGAVGALVVALIVAFVTIIIVVALKKKRTRKQKEINCRYINSIKLIPHTLTLV